MKTSFVSSLAMQNNLRLTIQRAQEEVSRRSIEQTTGEHADLGVALGAGTARNLDLSDDMARLDAVAKSNALVSTRLQYSEASLKIISEAASRINGVLVPSGEGAAKTLEVINKTISDSFADFIAAANTAVAGEFLFSGIHTDVKPLEDFQATGSPAKKAFDDELTQFMTTLTPPVTDKTGMTASQMTGFLTHIEKVFNGKTPLTAPANAGKDFWTTFMSKASDQNMSSRISTNEVIESSTNTNAQGMRYLALVSAIGSEFMKIEYADDVRKVVSDQAIAFVNKASDGITQQRSALGLSQERTTKATESAVAQQGMIKKYLLNLRGVDVYESKIRMDLLNTQVRIAYELTTKLQQMSLVNFL